MKYRIYIDEVGNPDVESSGNPIHRFLSLTGVILELGYAGMTVHPQIEELKKRFFDSHPDDPIIFHRKEMVNAVEPFHRLKDASHCQKFDKELLRLLQSWQYTVISVCLDKRRHKETYTTWRYDPYHYCLAILLERYAMFLEHNNAAGDAMAESRGGKEDMRLKKSFEKLYSEGTEYIDPAKFQKVFTSRQLKVKPKANNIAGLQLADMVAHPSRNEILQEQGLLDRPMGVFAAQVVKTLQNKYYQREGRIFGKKFV